MTKKALLPVKVSCFLFGIFFPILGFSHEVASGSKEVVIVFEALQDISVPAMADKIEVMNSPGQCELRFDPFFMKRTLREGSQIQISFPVNFESASSQLSLEELREVVKNMGFKSIPESKEEILSLVYETGKISEASGVSTAWVQTMINFNSVRYKFSGLSRISNASVSLNCLFPQAINLEILLEDMKANSLFKPRFLDL